MRAIMTTPHQQIDWVRAVMAHLNLTANGLAARAGIAPSTLQRPLNDDTWSGSLSARTMGAIAKAAGLRPMEFPQAGTFGELEASPYEFSSEQDAISANTDRAVRELIRGRNGREAWVAHGSALEMQGVLAGDILIVDMNLQAKPHDIVLAQINLWARGRSETAFRVYEPPYLLTHSMRNGLSKPVPVDDRDVLIRGVVDGLVRRRRH